MKVIAISGWKGSGKDTAANYLIEKKNYLRVAFADPLKDMVATTYNIPRSSLDDPKVKEVALEQYPVLPSDPYALNVCKFMFKEFRTLGGHPPMEYHIDASGAFLGVLGRHVEQLYWTPRSLAILEGSIKRTVTSQYWVQAAIAKVDRIKSADVPGDVCYGFVISDLRYVSEVTQLRQAFGKDLVTVRINRFDDLQSTDPSERNLDNYQFDVVIDNKGTIEDLNQQLETLCLSVK
jgi:deoxynucleotide monophosphate kinase-like protein